MHPIINVDSCYVCEMFSFISVIAPECRTSGSVNLTNSVFYDLQDGAKMVVDHQSGLAAHVVGCQFDTRQVRRGGLSQL